MNASYRTYEWQALRKKWGDVIKLQGWDVARRRDTATARQQDRETERQSDREIKRQGDIETDRRRDEDESWIQESDVDDESGLIWMSHIFYECVILYMFWM